MRLGRRGPGERQATLREVARAVGVSQATASRVLNGVSATSGRRTWTGCSPRPRKAYDSMVKPAAGTAGHTATAPGGHAYGSVCPARSPY
ncbi:LacI family DNA-binding transcriptional regulator [Streptomyces sp. NPDC018693]|uniref:LacI family DNA-binding transcriptional regulator n=1 Tax=unclassified Streptomyces TaxID=2593676 RepID=UPI00379780F0